MIDIEAMAEARAIAIYEAVNDDTNSRTPWTHLPPGEWDKWRRAANVAQQVAVPQGWRLVPLTITENMHRAAVCMLTHCNGNDDFPPRVYKAMLAEAPQPPQEQVAVPQEPVAIITECPVNGQQTVTEIEGRWKFLRTGDLLYSAPQPAYVPLTDEQAKKLCSVGPVYAPGGVVSRSPISYRAELEKAILTGFRIGEAVRGKT